jgi:hypothetical protein
MKLSGSYNLTSFEIEDLQGVTKSWGTNLSGLLIYTPTGHMSVSINKAIENDPEQTDEQNLFDSILFYSGTYAIEGDLIRHQVMNASNPSRIGKEMLRYASWNPDQSSVTLATPKESFGRAILTWQKIG